MKEDTKFFVNDLNSHLGQVVCSLIRASMQPSSDEADEDAHPPKHEICGTVRAGEEVPSFIDEQNVAFVRSSSVISFSH